jgi:uncharacterized protein (TIGR02996 family)
MNDDGAFVRAILDAPEDESRRLVYADWLDERADPRGEYLRLDVELARLPGRDPARSRLRERLDELRDATDPAWARSVCFRPIATVEHLVGFLREYHRPWIASPARRTLRLSDNLPYGLELIYRELAPLFELPDDALDHRSPFAAQDALYPCQGLRMEEGMLVFACENQGVWTCRCPLEPGDPPVYSNAVALWDPPGEGFQKVCDSLNHFLITLALQEAVMSSECLVATREHDLTKALRVTARPLWLNGRYVQSEPSHDFFALPEEGVVVMRDADLWLGSYGDVAECVLKSGVDFRRIG